MIKLLSLTAAIILVILVVGCKNSADKAIIYTEKSELIATIDDQKALDEVVAAWKAKERALEKLMPLFEYKIEMDINGEKQVWFFNKAGYLMQENTSTLYKTSQKEVLSQYVK